LERCPGCRGRTFEVALGTAANFARRQCDDCRRNLRLVRADPARALEWATNLRIRSGDHAGHSLGQIVRTRSGWNLLAWLAEKANSADLRRAARIVLGHLAGPR
jgi:hypothetical protein